MRTIELKVGIMAVVLLLAACGDEAPPSDDKLVKTTISGIAFMAGLEADANVKVYGFDAEEKGSIFGFCMTDQDGAWTVDLGSKHGDLLVEVDAQGLTMKRLLPEVDAGDKLTDISVSPVTTLSTSLAEYYLSAGVFEAVGDAREYADNLVFGHFGNLAHGRIVPVPFSPGIEELAQEVIAGLLTEALAMQAIKVKPSANMVEFVSLLVEDIGADGLFDGNGRGGKLAMGTFDLSGDTLRPEFARLMAGFLSSPNNQTGFGLPELEDVVMALASNESEIFPGRPGEMDWTEPDVDILEPLNGSTVSGIVNIRISAWDKNGVIEMKSISPEGLEIGFDGTDWLGAVDTTLFTDGEMEISVEAEDWFENKAEASVKVDVRNHTKLAGAVYKGFLNGATVEAYDFDQENMLLLASTVTDEDGRFVLEMGPIEGTVLVVATSGTYVEEALAMEVELARGEYLSAVVPGYNAYFQGAVTVSPLSTWAAEFAGYLVEEGFAPGDAAEQANEAIGEHFGVDAIDVLPVDLLRGEACDTLTERVKVSLICAGLSQMAEEISLDSGLTPGAVVNAITLTDALAEDIGADGLFDGLGERERLTQGNYELSSYTTRNELAIAVNNWITSQMNTCSVGIADFKGLADWLAADDGELFPEDEPPIPVDESAPVFVFETHADGQPVKGIIHVSVLATDEDALAALEITSPSGIMSNVEVVDEKNWRISFDLDTTQKPDGPFNLSYRAVDRTGNVGVARITLLIDNTPPLVDWTEPEEGEFLPGPSVAFSGTATDEYSGVHSVKVNGESADIQHSIWSKSLSLGEGEHTVALEVTDRAGNVARMNRVVYVDSTSPTLSLADSAWISDRLSYPCVCDLSQMWCTMTCITDAAPMNINEQLFQLQNPTFEKIAEKLTYTGPADIEGNNLPTFRIRASDSFGITTTLPVDLVVEYRYTFRSENPSSWTRVPFSPGDGYTHVLPISTSMDSRIGQCGYNEMHTVEIRVKDPAGNAASKEYIFKIKIIPAPLEISVDSDYASDDTDPHNLRNLAGQLETCSRRTSKPFLNCNNDLYEELFEEHNDHPDGLRIEHVTIRNPNNYAVKMRVPFAATEAKIWMLTGKRIIAYDTFYSIMEFPGCDDTCSGENVDVSLSGQCQRDDFLDYACSSNCGPASSHLGSISETPMQDLALAMELRKGTPTGQETQKASGFYELEPNTTYHLYTTLPRIPTVYHRHSLVNYAYENRFNGVKYRHKYRGTTPSGTVYIRRGPSLSSLTTYEYLKRATWEMGFRLEYDVRPFDLFIARGDRENSAFVQGNLSDIRQGGDIEVVNEESVISRFPYE